MKIKISLLTFSIFFGISGIILFYENLFEKKVAVQEVFQNKPWASVLDPLPPVKGIGLPLARNCGGCHEEIYSEWKHSTHAHALSDLQFQSELQKPSSPDWLCLNCHIPVGNQRENIVSFLKNGDYKKPIFEKNPNFSPEMQAEGVNCATCHVRVDKEGNAYILGSNGETDAPHPVQVRPNELKNICQNCHEANYRLNDELVCTFGSNSEMQEWKDIDNNRTQSTCGSCHMPEIQRSFVKKELNKPTRISHIHGFVGGGVPKEFPLYSAQISGGYKRGISVKKWELEKNHIIISIQNTFAGHYIPTGDPERYLLIEIDFLNENRQSIHSESFEIGQVWEWWPKAKKVSDNRLKPGEIRDWKFKIPISGNPKTFQFRVTMVRLRQEVMEYMKSNAGNLPPELGEKIKNIEEHYPTSSVILEASLDLQKRSFQEKDLQKLMEKNAKPKSF